MWLTLHCFVCYCFTCVCVFFYIRLHFVMEFPKLTPTPARAAAAATPATAPWNHALSVLVILWVLVLPWMFCEDWKYNYILRSSLGSHRLLASCSKGVHVKEAIRIATICHKHTRTHTHSHTHSHTLTHTDTHAQSDSTASHPNRIAKQYCFSTEFDKPVAWDPCASIMFS